MALLVSRPSPAGAQQTEVKPIILGGGPPPCIPVRPDSSEAAGPRVIIAGPPGRVIPPCRTPISPRRAFLTSLLAPGLAQARLGRPRAAGFFAAVEAGAIGMAIKSQVDLNRAKDAREDTLVVPVLDPSSGRPVLDPVTGLPRTVGEPRNRNLADRVKARRTHLEDWLAAIVFNHLISGADAFVAANLADFDTNVSVTSGGLTIRAMARVSW